MAVIATTIEPNGIARIFFDCRAADADPDEEARIAEVIEQAFAMADGETDRTPQGGVMPLPLIFDRARHP